MKTLATMLAELMRADAVPMSDGWGQLYDRLLCVLNQDPTPESSGEIVVKDLPK